MRFPCGFHNFLVCSCVVMMRKKRKNKMSSENVGVFTDVADSILAKNRVRLAELAAQMEEMLENDFVVKDPIKFFGVMVELFSSGSSDHMGLVLKAVSKPAFKEGCLALPVEVLDQNSQGAGFLVRVSSLSGGGDPSPEEELPPEEDLTL